jgi:hypothetical protein
VFTHLGPLEDPASFADTELDRTAQLPKPEPLTEGGLAAPSPRVVRSGSPA